MRDKPLEYFITTVLLIWLVGLYQGDWPRPIQDIIDGKPVALYPQPPATGTTYLGRDVKPHILASLERDMRAGWMRDELARLRDW